MNKKLIDPIISILVLAFVLILPIIVSMHIFHYGIVLTLYVIFTVIFFSLIFIGKIKINPIYIYLLTILLILGVRFYDNKFYEVASFFVVPKNFQGKVNVVFGIKGSPALSFKKHCLYMDQFNGSVIFTSTEANKLPREIAFTYNVDTPSFIDNNPTNDFSFRRSFALGDDTLKVNKKVFTYFTVFITKDFHKDTDSIVVESMRLDNSNKDGIREAIINFRKP